MQLPEKFKAKFDVSSESPESGSYSRLDPMEDSCLVNCMSAQLITIQNNTLQSFNYVPESRSVTVYHQENIMPVDE
jgi:hypothetical protein